MLYLRKPEPNDIAEIKNLYKRSVSIHQPWTYPPQDYESFIHQENRYFLCKEESQEIVGTFHISGIIRGYFQSAYLGYEVFSPYHNQGYMRQGMVLLLEEAFDGLNLHRLEANIQPENIASIRLVAKAGFVKEGYSKNYLRIGGLAWKDHERWAIINPHWSSV